MPDVFLSYSREDQVVARRFAAAFESEGLTVWWDQTLRTGEAYDHVTEQALRAAKAVVVLWSKASVTSRWVRAEATLADRNHTLAPVMIDDCERPIMFELIQTADLASWTGHGGDPAWKSFLDDVHRQISRPLQNSPESPPDFQVRLVSGASAADHRPSLAILPFANRSRESADDVFADGMEEDLIAALSLGGSMRVIARSASIAHRNSTADLRTIGRELGVRYLLEGNVRRVGSNLRVTAQLVEAQSAAVLWVQRFDRPLSELADLQEQLVTELASNLGVQVDHQEMERALKKPANITAWEAVMRSRANLARSMGLQAASQAAADARQAIAIAPDFALAHALLSDVLGHRFMASGGRDVALALEAKTHAERALALAPGDPQVLAVCAITIGYTGNWNDSLKYAQRAVKLNPNSSWGYAALGMACIRFGNPQEAVRHFISSEELTPGSLMNFIMRGMRALSEYLCGNLERALQLVDDALLTNRGFNLFLKDRAVYLHRLGRLAEARATIGQLKVAHPQLTLEDVQRANSSSFLPSSVAEEMNVVLQELWET